MFYDKPVTIYSKGEPTKVRGEMIYPDSVKTEDILADVQPYSSELAHKEYGLEIQTTNRMFCDLLDIEMGKNLVEYKGKMYDITGIVPWDDYLEVMLDATG